MRSTTHTRSSRSESPFSWNWLIVVWIIAGIFGLNWLFWWSSWGSVDKSNWLLVIPGSGSEVYIKQAHGSSKQIEWEESLYTTDESLSIINGFAEIRSSFLNGFLDKSSELTYLEHRNDGEKIDFIRGRLWIESHGNTSIQMKNLEATAKNGDVIMVEQPNQIFSTLYVLKGNISITAGGGNSYTLTPGRKIMISKSDLANPGTTLDMLSGPIDDTLKQNPLFILRNGGTLLSVWTGTMSLTGRVLSSTGSLSGSMIQNTWGKFIEITSPLDESIIPTQTLEVVGKILSKEVKRVTINDIDAIVSPVDASFSLRGMTLNGETLNLVYKAYSKDATLLEKWVLTLYPKNHQTWADKLTPTNFPVNDKDYKITSPLENPYSTTDANTTVRGIVPKNTIQYITVNNFRLKKFIPNSTSWYYFANISNDTLKEGINLYEIDFYGQNDTLLYKKLFTIVKEKKSTISGENPL